MKLILMTGDNYFATTDFVSEMGIVKHPKISKNSIWDLEVVKSAKALILDGDDLIKLQKKPNKDELLKAWLSVEEFVVCRA